MCSFPFAIVKIMLHNFPILRAYMIFYYRSIKNEEKNQNRREFIARAFSIIYSQWRMLAYAKIFEIKIYTISFYKSRKIRNACIIRSRTIFLSPLLPRFVIIESINIEYPAKIVHSHCHKTLREIFEIKKDLRGEKKQKNPLLSPYIFFNLCNWHINNVKKRFICASFNSEYNFFSCTIASKCIIFDVIDHTDFSF